MTLTLKIEKEIKPSEVVDLLDMVYARYSPWCRSIRVLDGERVQVSYDDPDEEEGTFTGLKTITMQEIVNSIQPAHEGTSGLCCREAMLSEELGMGCSDDADLILQWAVFGEVVYG